jgi:transcriptional regulator with XRE-family HTH domain
MPCIDNVVINLQTVRAPGIEVPPDGIVGRNIRVYRLVKGLSQTQLADQLGLTFQQVQKYEKGKNRIGAGRLFEISKILDVPLLSMFEGSKVVRSKADRPSPFDLLADPLSLRLVQAFAEIAAERLKSLSAFEKVFPWSACSNNNTKGKMDVRFKLPFACAKHQRSPGFRPAKPNSGIGVERSFPRDLENSRNAAVITTHTVWLPTSSCPVLQQTSR